VTASRPDVLRALDPIERYFWLLGQVASMNLIGMAELDCQLETGVLTESVQALQARHPLLRARVEQLDGEFVFVEAPRLIPVEVRPVTSLGWTAEVQAELATPFAPAPAPLCRCVYLPFTDRDRSALLVVVHHVMIDGRSLPRLVQQIVRQVDSAGPALVEVAELPGPLTERFAEEIRSPRARIEVLREVQRERKGQAEPVALPFHHREVASRRPRFDLLEVEPDQMPPLRDRARAAGASVYGLLAAATLEATAALFEGAADRVICLATPTDLRNRVDPPEPDDSIRCAVGLLSTPYPVATPPDPGLGRRITEQTRKEVARGESHLFYAIVRAGLFPANDDGIARFADWVAQTPQNVAVSNVGVVDDQGDPSWVRSVGVSLGCSPNQMSFMLVTTYRGRMVITVTTDSEKLAPEVTERFLHGVMAQTGAHRVGGEAA
jgi:hypothetical protein